MGLLAKVGAWVAGLFVGNTKALKWIVSTLGVAALVSSGWYAFHRYQVLQDKVTTLTEQLATSQHDLGVATDQIKRLSHDLLVMNSAVTTARTEKAKAQRRASDLLQRIHAKGKTDAKVRNWLDGRLPAGVAQRLHVYSSSAGSGPGGGATPAP